jgi:hypothetical protein
MISREYYGLIAGTNFRKPVIKLSRPGLVAEVHIVKNTEAFL